MVPEWSGMTYAKRREYLYLPTLKDRRSRGDMITIYRFIGDYDEVNIEQFLEIRRKSKTI